MKRSGSSRDDRSKRLGPGARGSLDFLHLCARRGVPPEKISAFLIGLGLDAATVNRWMDHIKREMAGIPDRSDVAQLRKKASKRLHYELKSERQTQTETEKVPASSLDGRTATDFILPDLDQETLTQLGEIYQSRKFEIEREDVSLEISDITPAKPRKAREVQEATESRDSPVPASVSYESPASLFSGAQGEIPVKPSGLRVQLEKPHERNRRHRKSRDDRKFLKSTESRIAAFAALVLITWLLSDSGWFPGGSARHSSLPASDLAVREEPAVGPPQASDESTGQTAPQAEPNAGDHAIQTYPDPWAIPTPKEEPARAPGSAKPSYHRSKSLKRQRQFHD